MKFVHPWWGVKSGPFIFISTLQHTVLLQVTTVAFLPHYNSSGGSRSFVLRLDYRDSNICIRAHTELNYIVEHTSELDWEIFTDCSLLHLIYLLRH